MLRLTPFLSLISLPVLLTHLLSYYQRQRPPISILTPTFQAIVISNFPIAWFFGFLYYTDLPSLLFVIWTVVAASQGNHWLASSVCVHRFNPVLLAI
jgi:alpha-1,2-glucosyltransferase